MLPFDEDSSDFVAETAREREVYDCAARHLQATILHATSKDIQCFPEAIKDRLGILARAAAILGLDATSSSAYSAALSKLSSDRLRIRLHLIHLKKAEGELRETIAIMRHQQTLAASWPKSADLEADTASLERQRRGMMVKAKEYQEELNIATSGNSLEQESGPTITSIIALQEVLRKKERDLKMLKARLAAFEGLPPNLELAKQELGTARENQIRLMNIREKLLGRMTLGLN